ncbi:Spermatocyte protein spe-27 [Caenorhabditis elegans]|uniref:Spermatocyte protein spe-27 n=1 Tax=Caenorhabditis elegans TaxID=6239 RepID=SPE27_CAEEL|nr:Spermatocyte protein spe-27 [Caenorhabditis elegans]P54218.1 RecName: Full=Spermatocyte protein spe-27; AltName: Full=Defective spermatogenesis protein 27; Flags: Precursor [Caenorhabditis elegans]AAC47276.1 SPE-27 [Caenorhabditis elegans]CCD63374.1 Spermatocyte protein spe-27 [Caenorhabditis elegans]|eukprot:NP_500875.1 Spermatocyte protein spe-27 [Caenorhabditis elegans]
MNKSLIFLLSFAYSCYSTKTENNFDINDVENKACQYGCGFENVRRTSFRKTYDILYTCSECSTLFDLCIKYRTCQDGCVPEMPVLPYDQAKDVSARIRPPMNPCLDLVTACNYESMDSYEILRSENPFLYI